MTMHGSGLKSIYAQNKLTILNPFVLDQNELRQMFNKFADARSVLKVEELPALVKAIQQGRGASEAEMAALNNCLDTTMSSRASSEVGVDIETFLSALTAIGRSESGGFDPHFQPKNSSNEQVSENKKKHILSMTREYGAPMLESQRVGWRSTSEDQVSEMEYNNRLMSTEISNYNDCVERHYNGRSVGAELSKHSKNLLRSQATQGKTSGLQNPVW